MDLFWLSGCAFFAGLIDAAVGGGGLIQLPALLLWLPREVASDVATVLGTNKLASMAGTSVAVRQYARRVPISWHSILPAAVTAFIFAGFGAMTVSRLSGALLEPVIFVLLILVACYTFVRPDLGRLHAPAFTAHRERTFGVLLGAILGFYDGFFGPGMGSFLLFAFVGLFGFDFLSATASAKVINIATNLSAVLLFASTGHISYRYAVPMAVCQIGGALAGSHLAMRHGNRLVRTLFLLISTALIVRFGWEMLR